MLTRRRFAQTIAAAGAALILPRRVSSRSLTADHPDPRPGIDASRVLTEEDLAPYPDVADVYEGIRQIPHIADGIRCQCGCADIEGMRSLLTCYESSRMALHCEICQTEGRMVVRLHGAGRTLDQIRAAVDARFGPHGNVHHSH